MVMLIGGGFRAVNVGLRDSKKNRFIYSAFSKLPAERSRQLV